MNIDTDGIYDRLIDAHEVSQLKELSQILGYSENWASKMKQRKSIPYEACLKTSLEKGLSMDYLMFGKVATSLSFEETKEIVDSSLWTAHKLKFLSLHNDADLDALSDFFTEKLTGQTKPENTEQNKNQQA